MNSKFYLRGRRNKLAQLYPYPAILWSGDRLSRNFPANRYWFRASSHFLYFTNLSLPSAAIYLNQGKLILFWDGVPPESVMWHGQSFSKEEIADRIDADQVLPLSELYKYSRNAATIPLSHLETYQLQTAILYRLLPPPNQLTGMDKQLAEAIVKLRLSNDKLALSEIKQAVDVSVSAHIKAIRSVTKTSTEAQLRSIFEGEIISHNLTCAYNSIVTINGHILHNEKYHNQFQAGDLLLADVGAETNNGWASDITRTYPVNGKFSPTQKDIYEVILAVHDRCIEKVIAGAEYRDIHLYGCLVLAEGLVSLGILQGKPEDLVAQNVHTLFFPHGLGHLLGLDVHDMEDLGDLAGYGNRERSHLFGLKYLRLDRTLDAGMVVTIEPGFYLIPSLLRNKQLRDKYRHLVNWQRLAQFADVKGIRIEDDILVTRSGSQVLSQGLPTKVEQLEALMSA